MSSFARLRSVALETLVRPGMLILDGGAGLGESTIQAARMTGPAGHVHAFDPNPEMLRSIEAQASAQELASRITFHQVLLGERAGIADFYQARGENAAYSTRNPELLKFHPDAQRQPVPLLALDGLNMEPDLIVLDVEGSEYAALAGGRDLLARRKPDVIIETHGDEVNGIGGSVAEMAALLDELGYPLFDLTGGIPTTAQLYGKRYGQQWAALVASPRLAEAEVLAMLTALWHREDRL
jgi:FkbM family methyltransferase